MYKVVIINLHTLTDKIYSTNIFCTFMKYTFLFYLVIDVSIPFKTEKWTNMNLHDNAVNYYGYDTKIMFSSVRTIEHVRNAIDCGVHTITVPWKIMKNLTDNHFTTLGTRQFEIDTRLMTVRVKDIVGEKNPVVSIDASISDALVQMSTGGFGAVSIVNNDEELVGIFTDGDLRRLAEKEGAAGLSKNIKDLDLHVPASIDSHELLYAAQGLFHEKQVDNLVVTDNGKVVGMIDIQDMVNID